MSGKKQTTHSQGSLSRLDEEEPNRDREAIRDERGAAPSLGLKGQGQGQGY